MSLSQPYRQIWKFRPGTWVGVVLVGGFAAWRLLGNLAAEPFFPDEMAMIGQAYYWRLYRGIDRDEHPHPWDDVDWLRYPAYDHPPLVKYVMGASMEMGGAPVPRDLGLWRQWLRGEYPPPEQPPKGLVAARIPIALCGIGACLVMFALGVQLRGRLTGLIAAALLAVNPLFSTLSRWAMGDVPAEFLVLIAVVLALWFWPRLWGPRLSLRTWAAFSALEGALVALAALMKLNGAIALVLVVGIAVLGGVAAIGRHILVCRLPDPNPESRIPNAETPAPNRSGLGFGVWGLGSWLVLPLALGVMIAMSLVIVWVLNPYLHARPGREAISQAMREGRFAPPEVATVQRLADMSLRQRVAFLFEFRRVWAREALANERFAEYRLPAWPSRVGAIFWQGFGRYSPFGARRPNWTYQATDSNGRKLERFDDCLWPGHHAQRGSSEPRVQTLEPKPPASRRASESAHQSRERKRADRAGSQESGFGVRDSGRGPGVWPCLWPAVIWCPLAAWGLGWMLLDGWRALRQRQLPLSWGAAFYVMAEVAVLSFYIPLAWDRYFLPVVPAGILAVVYGVSASFAGLGRRLVLEPPKS